jgi:hypothetical protein
MASGLQCPGCGHVHPAGLPEIARGDATFRCYGCYRTLSIPEGWSGRPSPRPPSPAVPLTEDAPAGAGTRDARSARLAPRGRLRSGPPAAPASGDLDTQMVSPVTLENGEAPAGGGTNGSAGGSTGAATRNVAAPLGWVAPRRSGAPVPTAMRAGVWAAAFFAGLILSAFILRKMGVLDVDGVIDLYAGSGPGRFGVLLLLLPMWALLSATIAHLSRETLAKRRRPRTPSRPPARTTSV